MNKKQKYLMPVAIAILLLFIAASGTKPLIEAKLEELKDLTISHVDLSKIEDGVYTGKHKVFPILAEVEVTVNNHAITKIELLKHDNGRGSAAEIIPDKVVEGQTLKIDAISGATYSSKIILKAIENALTGADN